MFVLKFRKIMENSVFDECISCERYTVDHTTSTGKIIIQCWYDAENCSFCQMGNDEHEWDSVFVMNANGKTIDKIEASGRWTGRVRAPEEVGA